MKENPDVVQVEVKAAKKKLSAESIICAVMAAMMIVVGILATVGTFLQWEEFITYYVAGTGYFAIVCGIAGLAIALTGSLDEEL